MNRPIKYRAWADEKMHDVRAISFTESGEVHRILDTEGVQRVPEALLQFTGLHDKNGTEIYEGSALSFNGRPATAFVSFREGSYWYGDSVLGRAAGMSEVIGDIYQNPELLK